MTRPVVGVDGTCGDAGSCGDCTFACGPSAAGTAGGRAGVAASRERAAVAASGVVIALLAGVLVAPGDGSLHRVLGAATAAAGLTLAVLGGVGLRTGGHAGDRWFARAVRLLPYATGLLLAGVVGRLVTALTGPG